jgi:VWFA-related protein
MKTVSLVAAAILTGLMSFMVVSSGRQPAFAQSPAVSSASPSRAAKPVTIPISIRGKGEKPEFELQMINLTVTEDGEPQSLLSIRTRRTNDPLTLAVLIQDDLVSSIGNEIKPLRDFINRLPRGSRVLVGYLRTGSLQVRQKFTTDLEKAGKALRIPVGFASAAPYNPYVEVIEAIRRFDSQPSGRRAILLVSDGLDLSHGADSSSAGQSLDLQRAVTEAQRRSIAVYAFYAPTVGGRDSMLAANAQGSLLRLAEETGGRAFFQGTGAPVSFDPFIKELTISLDQQIALTYLSTHPEKGFHRIEVRSLSEGVQIDHPSGYIR